jgi:alpha-tubulin suppressor-like RCC1 family protein
VLPPPQQCVGAFSLASEHACAVRKTDGTVLCWGTNVHGELGDGTLVARSVPTAVKNLPGKATGVSTGESHSCALLEDQTVWCWGDDSKGNLGDNFGATTVDGPPVHDTSRTPVQVRTGVDVAAADGGTSTTLKAFTARAISSGGGHTCAIGVDQRLYCWGENKAGAHGGQCGSDPSKLDDVVIATVVEGLDAVVQIGTGDEFTCAIKDDSSVWCFGSNETGSLGNGPIGGQLVDSFVPVAVTKMASTSQLAVADESACARKNDSTVYCWGYNGAGSIGRADLCNATDGCPDQAVPVRTTTATAVSSGGGSFVTCVLQGRTLQCWGQNDVGQTGTGSTEAAVLTPTNAYLTSVDQVTTGATFACATTIDNVLWCWGSNSQGQLGNDAPGVDAPTPVRVAFPCE